MLLQNILYKNLTIQFATKIKYLSNMTGATSGAGTAYTFGAPEFTPFVVGLVLLDL